MGVAGFFSAWLVGLKRVLTLGSLMIAIVIFALNPPLTFAQFTPCRIVNLNLSFPTQVRLGQSFNVTSNLTVYCYGFLPVIRVDLVDARNYVILSSASISYYSSSGGYIVTMVNHATAPDLPGSWALLLEAYVIDRVSGFSIGWASQLFQVIIDPNAAEATGTEVIESATPTVPNNSFSGTQPITVSAGQRSFTRVLQPEQFYETKTRFVSADESSLNPTIGVCYSPGYSASDCVGLLVYWIERANSTINILTYSLISPNITEALIQAAARHVDVKIVVGGFEARYGSSQYSNLTRASLNVRLSEAAYEMHDTILIIDSHIILFDSFEWDQINYFNGERFLVFDSSSLGAAYGEEFQAIWNTSA